MTGFDRHLLSRGRRRALLSIVMLAVVAAGCHSGSQAGSSVALHGARKASGPRVVDASQLRSCLSTQAPKDWESGVEGRPEHVAGPAINAGTWYLSWGNGVAVFVVVQTPRAATALRKLYPEQDPVHGRDFRVVRNVLVMTPNKRALHGAITSAARKVVDGCLSTTTRAMTRAERSLDNAGAFKSCSGARYRVWMQVEARGISCENTAKLNRESMDGDYIAKTLADRGIVDTGTPICCTESANYVANRDFEVVAEFGA